MIFIMSDKQQDYQAFMAETLQTLADYNIRGVAIVALTDDETLTGYWNMSLRDKSQAETEIRCDVIDGLIMANKDRYFPPDLTE